MTYIEKRQLSAAVVSASWASKLLIAESWITPANTATTALVTHFRYVNVLYSRWKLGKNWGLNTQVQPLFALLTGINSEYGHLTGRPYDFGTGVALQLAGVLNYKGYPVLRLAVLDMFSGTINGAKGRRNLLIPVVQGRWQIAKSVGVGFDYWAIQRNSYYDDFRTNDGAIIPLKDTSTTAPTFRLNVTFSWFTQVTGKN